MKFGDANGRLRGNMKTKSMKVNYLTLKRLSDIHYTPYKQVKGEANPFDPEYDDYFSQRKEQQMLESLKGRKSLSYIYGTSRTGFVRYVARK